MVSGDGGGRPDDFAKNVMEIAVPPGNPAQVTAWPTWPSRA